MHSFFDEHVLLRSPTAEKLYASVKDLPIIDCHCHLDEKAIRRNAPLSDLGELWLGGDHYKWRAMRLCGVDEAYITGNAPMHDKYMKYAEIFPRLAGSPLYYWTQLELSLMFDIHDPFGPDTAEAILEKANAKLKGQTVQDLLARFKVQCLATTDDPTSPLEAHGTCGNTLVIPSFRPDRIISMDEQALKELAMASGTATDTLPGVKAALEQRLHFFKSKGCRMTDHGMDFLPVADCGDTVANDLYARRVSLCDSERELLTSHMLYFLASLYKRESIVMQMHFGTYRNVNTSEFGILGRDTGFDIMRGAVDTDRMVNFLDTLNSRNALPRMILYTLNPSCLPALCTLSGAFPDVRIGAAWWFNDTKQGIRQQIQTVAEYAVLGTNLGMLTDSRSFASYARFDFYRRILADVVGEWVENGEYALPHAEALMQDLCYRNIREFMGL